VEAKVLSCGFASLSLRCWTRLIQRQGADIQSAWQVSKIPSLRPPTERVKAALLTHKKGANQGWVFPSKRSRSGYITDREVSKQWLEAKRIAGIPENVVLYCARHRF
jgi:hypothetical protein